MTKALALTIGEPAGIGPDLTLALWRRRAELDLPAFYFIGEADFLCARARTLGLDVPVVEVEPKQAAAAFARALPVVPLGLTVTVAPGKPDAGSAPAAIAAIRRAVKDVMAGEAAAVVTNPIAKSVLSRAGFAEPGHTEFLAKLAEEATGTPVTPVMMLWSPELGEEDATIVAPAVAQLRAEGIAASGPLPADTLFHARARAGYDVALCMYHDQALIPIKTVAFDHGVNVTLGLPFVRTSPDHGTAFDLAGTGKADPGSLLSAMKLAARLTTTAPALAPAK